jgi:acyl-CoA reductase-like NAD-dependent aldehyde dehydrogenase
MQVRDKIYIDGAWVPSTGAGTLEVINASTEEVMGSIPEGTEADVDKAVAAAKAAFPAWAATPIEERGKYIQRITEGLGARMAEIAQTVAGELGMPLNLAMLIQAGLPAANWGAIGGLLDTFEFETQIGSSLVVREPVGVVGAITPWNYPLHQITLKVAPALAAGCTVVLKPSEVAPLNAFILTEIIDEVGLPAGVFNLVSGIGPVVGEAIASNKDVDMISFTGSTRAGKRVAELAAQRVARVALELGGKSANIILDDADLATAVADGVGKAFLNSGQTCSALTRMLVPRDKLAEAEQIAVATAETFTPGDPFGGEALLTGGAEQPEGLDKGYYVKPTVFSNVTNDMVIAQEEIFGPVLSIIAYDTEEEAIEIANDTIYGLAGGVWSGDKDRATRVARQLRTGQVEVNGGSFNLAAPFGGYKQSGLGREAGTFGLEEFLEIKSLQL